MNYNAVFMLTGLSLIKKNKVVQLQSPKHPLLDWRHKILYLSHGFNLLTSLLLLQERPREDKKEHLEGLSCIIETYTPVLFLHFMCTNRWCELKL